MTHVLDPDQTLEGYDRWAASYDALANPMVAATAWALDRTPLGCADEDVLELGCGTGRNVARVLAEGAHSYTGVDGSAGMLEAARRACPDPRARFVRSPLVAELPVGTFDLAFVVLVLEHIADLATVFAGARRALRPGGRLRLVEIHPDLVATGTVAHFEDAAGAVRFTSTAHPVPALRAALEAAGFAVEALREFAAEDVPVPKLAKHAGRRVLVDVEAVAR